MDNENTTQSQPEITTNDKSKESLPPICRPVKILLLIWLIAIVAVAFGILFRNYYLLALAHLLFITSTLLGVASLIYIFAARLFHLQLGGIGLAVFSIFLSPMACAVVLALLPNYSPWSQGVEETKSMPQTAVDQLHTDTTIILENNVDPETILPFVGQWGTKKDGVIYTISDSFQLETIASPPWETIIKHIHFDGQKLSFYSYSFTDKSDDYKTITNSSGEHPFSGVRVYIEFTLNPNNPDELVETGSTRHTTETIKETLIRIQ